MLGRSSDAFPLDLIAQVGIAGAIPGMVSGLALGRLFPVVTGQSASVESTASGGEEEGGQQDTETLLWGIGAIVRLLLTAIAVVALALAVGAGFARRQQESNMPIELRDLPAQFIPGLEAQLLDSTTWISQDEIVFVSGPADRSRKESLLYTVRLNGTGVQRISLPNEARCREMQRSHPSRLPDGRLAFVQACLGVDTREQNTLMVFDHATQRTERLVSFYLSYGVESFTFAPDLHMGIVANRGGNSPYNELWWIYPDRYEILTLPFECDHAFPS